MRYQSRQENFVARRLKFLVEERQAVQKNPDLAQDKIYAPLLKTLPTITDPSPALKSLYAATMPSLVADYALVDSGPHSSFFYKCPDAIAMLIQTGIERFGVNPVIAGNTMMTIITQKLADYKPSSYASVDHIFAKETARAIQIGTDNPDRHAQNTLARILDSKNGFTAQDNNDNIAFIEYALQHQLLDRKTTLRGLKTNLAVRDTIQGAKDQEHIEARNTVHMIDHYIIVKDPSHLRDNRQHFTQSLSREPYRGPETHNKDVYDIASISNFDHPKSAWNVDLGKGEVKTLKRAMTPVFAAAAELSAGERRLKLAAEAILLDDHPKAYKAPMLAILETGVTQGFYSADRTRAGYYLEFLADKDKITRDELKAIHAKQPDSLWTEDYNHRRFQDYLNQRHAFDKLSRNPAKRKNAL